MASISLIDWIIIPYRMRGKDGHSYDYGKPTLVELGSVTELMQGTVIKGHAGVLESPIGHWRIIPAYDLDE